MRGEDSGDLPVTRRGVVTAAALAAASTAGCSGVTDRSYEASPVGLSAGNQNDMWLGEAATDSFTVEFDGPAVVEAEVTNHTAVYRRAAGTGEI